jgi:Plasmid pRiA4b ORF-3-like protein
MPNSPQRCPVRLTQTQRKIVAEIVPELADILKLDEPVQRIMRFTVAELTIIQKKAAVGLRSASTGMKRNSFRHVGNLTFKALERSQGSGTISVAKRLYQFKITLIEIHPPIWRRIQVKDCTLDKLHGYIQTAMGWTNSHLHRFKINDKEYGDPDLLDDEFENDECEDSTSTRLSDILPKTGKRFPFEYDYDFGDCWKHEVLFEGCVRAEPGGRYPVCVEGARACPPEDMGGVGGYEAYQEAMADPDHERHGEFMGWRGPFDPEAFDAAKTTKAMRRGLPDWRSASWI